MNAERWPGVAGMVVGASMPSATTAPSKDAALEQGAFRVYSGGAPSIAAHGVSIPPVRIQAGSCGSLRMAWAPHFILSGTFSNFSARVHDVSIQSTLSCLFEITMWCLWLRFS